MKLEFFIDFLSSYSQNLAQFFLSNNQAGSGFISTFLMKMLKKCSNSSDSQNPFTIPFFLCSDINPIAAATTKSTLSHNFEKLAPNQQGPVPFDVIQCCFCDPFEARLKNKIDVLMFNPPYVPSEPEELGQNDIRAAWAGGVNGREVIDQLLPKIDGILSPKGVFYLLVLDENNPNEIRNIMETKYGFLSNIVNTRYRGGERLYILKFWRGK